MTLDIALVLVILAVSLVLFVTEVLRMDLVALLVLVALALTGLVTPAGAVAGFSNPAVITVWAMFILSAGLTRTGVAEILGNGILRWTGRGEAWTITVIATTAAVLSAFMNNIGVAALMLPAVLTVARRTGTPPSRLLMPLAYGSLLGGLTTLIGTPPNLLVADALRKHGLEPFGMFDFTPVGGLVLIAGIAFLAIVGRRMLPRTDPAAEASGRGPEELAREYRLEERSAVARIPEGSPLDGRTLAATRLGSAARLNVFAVQRGTALTAAPGPEFVLRAGDRLLVEGKLDRFEELRAWRDLVVRDDDPGVEAVVSSEVGLAEPEVAPGGALDGRTLAQIDFRKRFGAIVLAVRRDGRILVRDLGTTPLRAGDRLLIQGRRTDLAALPGSSGLVGGAPAVDADLFRAYGLRARIFCVQVPVGSALDGTELAESRVGDALGVGVLGLKRGEETLLLPEARERLRGGDVLFVRGTPGDLEGFRGLQGLEIESESRADLAALTVEGASVVEAILSPRTTLARKTPAELRFRERYGLQLLAILRRGVVHRSNLAHTPLQFGDALLLVGPRERLVLLARDPDFVTVSGHVEPAPERAKAPLAALVMAAVIAPVLLGWIPIAISAVAGAAVMVLARCLSMDDAYRAIEWRAIFLIAGMLPLGTALDDTGAATFLAEGMLRVVQPFGPWAVLITLYLATAIATAIIPTAALVVLMSPIALTACEATGLSPYAVMMAIAMAASASFTSPVSHPANILVMGPGGYRFVDYVKIGVPLTLTVLAVVLLVLPLFWPILG